jgi:hypothetical protein
MEEDDEHGHLELPRRRPIISAIPFGQIAGGAGFSTSPHSRPARVPFVADVAQLQNFYGLMLSSPQRPPNKKINPQEPQEPAFSILSMFWSVNR